MDKKKKAAEMLRQWKGDRYVFGLNCFNRLGTLAADLGNRVSVVTSGIGKEWGNPVHEATLASLAAAELDIAGDLIQGTRPNAPREDVMRIANEIQNQKPDVMVAVGGGSVIDAVKAALCIVALDSTHTDLDEYFGVSRVSELLKTEGKKLLPLVAVQLASGSAAHLTRYSNVTDLDMIQKKLIVDEAIIPPKALFDYEMTTTMSPGFTADGGLDGVAHALEVFYGARDDTLEKVRPVACLAIDLIVNNLKKACESPVDPTAREAIGLGTDLGGYAIMIGGTNGAHLTSFSLVDILSHGRACALMNPYYTVFFAPFIQDQLRDIGKIYKAAGFTHADIDNLCGRDLGLAIAEAMIALSNDIGFPTTLSEVDGFTDDHISRALTAAKNPQLKMKLQNMPVPISAEQVDDYMGPVLEAARTGDFNLIKNIESVTD